jgi:hypothetical protein
MRCVATVVAILLACAPARAEPSNERLVLIGVALAPPDYILGVSLHEGSHALMAKLLGASVDELHLFPPGTDRHTNTFRWGWTYVHGLQSRSDRLAFYIAPKITDAVLMSGLAALVFTDAWPSNKYGSLALTVFGTGLWIDFAKDVVLLSPHNDVSKVLSLWCMTGWRNVVARITYGAIDLGFAYAIYKSYERTFSSSTSSATTPLVVPLLGTAF